MSRPGNFQSDFDEALDGGPLPQGVTAVGDVEQRFAVYQNNVAHSLIEALAQRFPVVQQIVGRTFFAAMSGIFVRTHRPRTPLMFEYGDGFPDFLASFPPVAHLGYLPDVALLEVLRGQAYHAADANPLGPRAFAEEAGHSPESVSLALHPSVRLQRSAYPVVAIWLAHQRGARSAASIAPLGETALIFRRKGVVVTQAIGTSDAAFVSALQYGATLSAAADASPETDIAALLALLLDQGLIVGVACAASPSERQTAIMPCSRGDNL